MSKKINKQIIIALKTALGRWYKLAGFIYNSETENG